MLTIQLRPSLPKHIVEHDVHWGQNKFPVVERVHSNQRNLKEPTERFRITVTSQLTLKRPTPGLNKPEKHTSLRQSLKKHGMRFCLSLVPRRSNSYTCGLGTRLVLLQWHAGMKTWCDNLVAWLLAGVCLGSA